MYCLTWTIFKWDDLGHVLRIFDSMTGRHLLSTTMSVRCTLKFDKAVSPSYHCAEMLEGYPKCPLRSDPAYSFVLPPQEIRVVRSLHDSFDTTVYLGRCEDNTEVALKFTAIDDIQVEAGVYDAMVDIQGRVIPKLYGVLYGLTTTKERMACMVLERFGDALDVSFSLLEKREKYVWSAYRYVAF